jgi:hypothetical protein
MRFITVAEVGGYLQFGTLAYPYLILKYYRIQRTRVLWPPTSSIALWGSLVPPYTLMARLEAFTGT